MSRFNPFRNSGNTVSIDPLQYAGVRMNDAAYATANRQRIDDLIANLPPSGGEIVLAAGEWWIDQPLTINRSYVNITGTVLGTRSNIDPEEPVSSIVTHPGGGTKLVLASGCGFGIRAPLRTADRISGITIRNLLIQGRGTDQGQLGISIEHNNDAVHILDVSFINLDTGIKLNAPDACVIRGCWVSEVRNCILQYGSSQQLLISDCHIGGQPLGKGIYLENPNWANITDNNIYPDHYVAIETIGASQCSFTGNNIQTYYTGAVVLRGDGNVFQAKIHARDVSGWWLADPLNPDYHADPDGRNKDYGVVQVIGNDNQISVNINSAQPADHVRVNIAQGFANWVTNSKIYGVGSGRKVVVNGIDATATRIIHSVPSSEVETGGGDAVVVW